MSVIKFIGRTTDFKGKTLWEIVGNLKNFGVGRLVLRNRWTRYPEPSYMKILKVQSVPNESTRKVIVSVERTFRGYTLPKPVTIYITSYKADYVLVPKSEQDNLLCAPSKTTSIKILPTTIELPPLLNELIVDEKGDKNLRINVNFHPCREKRSRLALPGETPNVEMSMGLGTPSEEKTSIL